MLKTAIAFVAGFVFLFGYSEAQAYHSYAVYPQNYQHYYYYYSYPNLPQIIFYPRPVTPPTYIFQPPPVYIIQPPPVIHYHIEVPPPHIQYHFHGNPDQPKTIPAEPILPPPPAVLEKPTDKQTCLSAGLAWLETGETISEDVFLPDDPKTRHNEHLKRFGRYDWDKKKFVELPETEQRYFGKETVTFSAKESGCYARGQSGQWQKINLR